MADSKTKKIELTISEEDYKYVTSKFKDKENEALSVAIEEFIDFLKNPKKFSKFSLFQEYRLFLIIKNIYKEKFVSEADVKKIFKIDSSPAQTMIKHVKVDYEDELSEFNKKSMKAFLEKEITQKDNEKYTFVCKSQTMIESLNMLIQSVNPNSKKIVKEKGSLCSYHIYLDEYNLLKKELNK